MSEQYDQLTSLFTNYLEEEEKNKGLDQISTPAFDALKPLMTEQKPQVTQEEGTWTEYLTPGEKGNLYKQLNLFSNA